MIRKEKPEMPLSEIKKSIEFAGPKPPILGKPKPRPKPPKPGVPKPPIKPIGPKPVRPGKDLPFQIMAKRMNDPNGFYYN